MILPSLNKNKTAKKNKMNKSNENMILTANSYYRIKHMTPKRMPNRLPYFKKVQPRKNCSPELASKNGE